MEATSLSYSMDCAPKPIVALSLKEKATTDSRLIILTGR